MKGSFIMNDKHRCGRFLLTALFVSILTSVVFYNTASWGAIPGSERTVLLNLYSSTNGGGWTNKTGWNGASGTECSWYGVTCDAGSNHVTVISMSTNNLTGSLPDISGLTGLRYFYVNINQLTGQIPSLSGLTSLQWFEVDNNQLTGQIPSLSGLTGLKYFDVDNNQLTGDPPSVPSPNALLPGDSSLCPNNLNNIASADWDAATGITPWYSQCTHGVTYNGNGNTGGSAPIDPVHYNEGDTVTVRGNTGAFYKTNYAFNRWNTISGGSGSPYAGGDTFIMGTEPVTLYAQWLYTTASPVRLGSTGYSDIQDAYNHCPSSPGTYVIESWDGLHGSDLVFGNPHSIKLSGGYSMDFTQDTGATLVSGSITVRNGSVVMDKIIIH